MRFACIIKLAPSMSYSTSRLELPAPSVALPMTFEWQWQINQFLSFQYDRGGSSDQRLAKSFCSHVCVRIVHSGQTFWVISVRVHKRDRGRRNLSCQVEHMSLDSEDQVVDDGSAVIPAGNWPQPPSRRTSCGLRYTGLKSSPKACNMNISLTNHLFYTTSDALTKRTTATPDSIPIQCLYYITEPPSYQGWPA